MIKPSEALPVKKSPYTPEHLTLCENDFDAAIRTAVESQTWPAVVGVARDGVPAAAVEHLAEKYREAGWCVVTFPSNLRDVRALISHQIDYSVPDAMALGPAGRGTSVEYAVDLDPLDVVRGDWVSDDW